MYNLILNSEDSGIQIHGFTISVILVISIALWSLFLLYSNRKFYLIQKIGLFMMIDTALALMFNELMINPATESNYWIGALYSLSLSSLPPLYFLFVYRKNTLNDMRRAYAIASILPAFMLVIHLMFFFITTPEDQFNHMALAHGHITPEEFGNPGIAYFSLFISHFGITIICLAYLFALVCGVLWQKKFAQTLDEYYANERIKSVDMRKSYISEIAITLPFIGLFLFPWNREGNFDIQYILMNIIAFTCFTIFGDYIVFLGVVGKQMEDLLTKETAENNLLGKIHNGKMKSILSTIILGNGRTGISASTTETTLLPEEKMNLIEDKKLYLVRDINIIKIAKEIDAQPFAIIYTLHNLYGTNFANYIRDKRLKYAKAQFDKGAVTDIPSIATAIGYSDVDAFVSDYSAAYHVTLDKNRIRI